MFPDDPKDDVSDENGLKADEEVIAQRDVTLSASGDKKTDKPNHKISEFFADFSSTKNIDDLVLGEYQDHKSIEEKIVFYASTIRELNTKIAKSILSLDKHFNRVMLCTRDGGTEIINTYRIYDLGDNVVEKIVLRDTEYETLSTATDDIKIEFNNALKIRNQSGHFRKDYMVYLDMAFLLCIPLFKLQYVLICYICVIALIFLFSPVNGLLGMLIRSSQTSIKDESIRAVYQQIKIQHLQIKSYKEMAGLNINTFIDEIYSGKLNTNYQTTLTMQDFHSGFLLSNRLIDADKGEIMNLLNHKSIVRLAVSGGLNVVIALLSFNSKRILRITIFLCLTFIIGRSVDMFGIYMVITVISHLI